MWGDVGPVDRQFESTSLARTKNTRGRAIATFVAVAFALLCLRAALLGPWLLLDADLGWHLGYGEWIASHLEIPKADHWSFTKLNAPYQLTQWGGEALLGAASLIGGSSGLLLLNCIAVASTLGLMFALATQLVSRPLATMVVGTCGFMLFAGAIRPTMFSWILAAGLALLFVKAVSTKENWVIGATAALVAVWANVHGSFALAAVAAMGFWCCMAASGIRAGCIGDAKACLGAVLLVGAATLLNPYGWKVWEAVYAVATLETTQNRYFSDWKAPEVMSGLALPAWLAAGACCIALARRKSKWLALACLGVIGISLSAQRNAGLAAIGANAVVCLALSGGWLDRRMSKEARDWKEPGVAWHVSAAVACLGSAAWVTQSVTEAKVRKAQSSLYPVVCQQGLAKAFEPVQRVNEAPKQVRLLNEFEHGGWWQRQGSRTLIAIDGRADLFGDQAYKDLETMKKGEVGWQQILAKLRPDAVCLNQKTPLFDTPAFQRDFQLGSADQVWALWVRRRDTGDSGRDGDRD